MAITYTDLLGLRLSTDFDDSLNYNFRKLDSLGSVFDVTADGDVVIRSQVGISFEANSPDLGGSSSGGEIDFGSTNVTGLTLSWDNVTDKTANTLPDLDTYIDSYATIVAHQAHVDASSGVHGITGDVTGTTDTQTLTNKTISALTNTISDIADAQIASGAAIDGDKIVPTFTGYVTSGSGLTLSGTYNTTIEAADSGQTEALTFKLPADYGTTGQFAHTDGLGNITWESVAGLTPATPVTWPQADPDTKVINHALGTLNISIDIYDENGNTIEVDTEERTDTNNVTLTRQGTASGDWTVLIAPL